MPIYMSLAFAKVFRLKLRTPSEAAKEVVLQSLSW
jgi:hypothetical protein